MMKTTAKYTYNVNAREREKERLLINFRGKSTNIQNLEDE